jgi:hypothetical protein
LRAGAMKKLACPEKAEIRVLDQPGAGIDQPGQGSRAGGGGRDLLWSSARAWITHRLPFLTGGRASAGMVLDQSCGD